MSDFDHSQSEGLFSKAVRAGKRTYFFDVRSTRQNDYYLTITESKKKFTPGGSEKPFFEKHKLFLYKEDFDKFMDGLTEAITAIQTNNVKAIEPQQDLGESVHHDDHVDNAPDEKPVSNNSSEGNSFSDISFEDLK